MIIVSCYAKPVECFAKGFYDWCGQAGGKRIAIITQQALKIKSGIS